MGFSNIGRPLRSRTRVKGSRSCNDIDMRALICRGPIKRNLGRSVALSYTVSTYIECDCSDTSSEGLGFGCCSGFSGIWSLRATGFL